MGMRNNLEVYIFLSTKYDLLEGIKIKVKLDSGTVSRFRAIYPNIATRAIRVFNDMAIVHGKCLRVTEGFRTFKRQEELYAIGRDTPGRRTVTNAKPGESFHNYGCAIDVCFRGSDPYLEKDPKGIFYWKEFGRLSKLHGFVWGGDFTYISDKPHIQLTYGLTLPEIQELFAHKGIKSVWAKFDKIRDVRVASEWKGIHTKVKIFKP